MLMGAVDRGVHAHHPVDLPGSVGVCEQLGVDLVPRPIARITAMPLLHRLPWAERTRHVTPRRADTVTPDDALDHTAIIPERATPPPGRRRQQQPNPIPLSIRQHTIATHTRVIPQTEPGIRRHALVQRVIPLRHASQGAPRTTIATQHPPIHRPRDLHTCTRTVRHRPASVQSTRINAPKAANEQPLLKRCPSRADVTHHLPTCRPRQLDHRPARRP